MSFKRIIISVHTVVLILVVGVFMYRFVIVLEEFRYQKLLKTYPHISKQVFKTHENDLILSFVALRKSLQATVAEYGDSFAFYFEYLPTGTSIGINEIKDFDLASLLKVPYVMAYYLSEQQSGLSSSNPIATIQQEDLDTQYGELWQRGVGTQIPITEVVKLSLVRSDNTAIRILMRYVNPTAYREVYDGLDIELTQKGTNPPTLSAKSYASILKALYFSSILTKIQSQEILGLLTQTPFKDKLVSGVPDGIPVAHKMGIINNETYSDCGIVYEPNRPYGLCLISHSSEDVARTRMKTISSMVYQYVHSVK